MGKIFEYNKDIDKTAYKNWRTKQDQPIHDMIILVDGYIICSKNTIWYVGSLMRNDKLLSLFII